MRMPGCVGNLLEHRACSVWRETALRRTCRSTRERAGQVTRAKDRPRQPHPASRRGSINHLPSYPSWHAPTLSLCQGGIYSLQLPQRQCSGFVPRVCGNPDQVAAAETALLGSRQLPTTWAAVPETDVKVKFSERGGGSSANNLTGGGCQFPA